MLCMPRFLYVLAIISIQTPFISFSLHCVYLSVINIAHFKTSIFVCNLSKEIKNNQGPILPVIFLVYLDFSSLFLTFLSLILSEAVTEAKRWDSMTDNELSALKAMLRELNEGLFYHKR